jgi:hypothetical protein
MRSLRRRSARRWVRTARQEGFGEECRAGPPVFSGGGGEGYIYDLFDCRFFFFSRR